MAPLLPMVDAVADYKGSPPERHESLNADGTYTVTNSFTLPSWPVPRQGDGVEFKSGRSTCSCRAPNPLAAKFCRRCGGALGRRWLRRAIAAPARIGGFAALGVVSFAPMILWTVLIIILDGGDDVGCFWAGWFDSFFLYPWRRPGEKSQAE